MIKYEDIEKIIANTNGLMHKHVETKFLFDLASQLPKGKNILEIGSYQGLSSLCLGFATKNIEGNLFCISLWTEELYIIWQNNIKINNVKAIPINGNANKILEHIHIENLGLIFIDSSHSYKDCKIQFELSTKYINDDCLVAFHDYDHPNYPGVKQYCDEIRDDGKLIKTNKVGSIFYGYIKL
jgi:predicted O-methyltransferase YrrM